MMINNSKIHRENIQNIFQKALSVNNSKRIVYNFTSTLTSNCNNIHVVAIGKSASAMIEGAIDALGRTLNDALLISKDDPVSDKVTQNPLIHTIISGHPIPDLNSLNAGEYLIKYCLALKSNDEILFLISGGTSSLVEYFPDSIFGLLSIDELQKLNKWLLASDKNIMQVNKIRKKISGIKAGRLLDYIRCKNITAFYISDVPDDNLKNIGSGLLVHEDTTEEIKNLPDWVNGFIKRSEKIPISKQHKDKNLQSRIIFSNSVLRNSIVEIAKSDGHVVHNMDAFISGNTIQEATRIAEWLKKQNSGVYIWGAETHMLLPESPGRGGRNQSFALVLAMQIQNISNMIVLVAGTDGNDGNTNDAGAIIDGRTIKRGQDSGLSATICLDNANAGKFLSASGDLLTLGETGTNVMDIIIALIWD